MSDFKAKMHQIICWLGLQPRPRVYSVYLVYLYILCNGLPPTYYKIVPQPTQVGFTFLVLPFWYRLTRVDQDKIQKSC